MTVPAKEPDKEDPSSSSRVPPKVAPRVGPAADPPQATSSPAGPVPSMGVPVRHMEDQAWESLLGKAITFQYGRTEESGLNREGL